MDKVIGVRNETTDYAKFRYQVGNRCADLQARKKKLIPSIRAHGQLHDIEVNENYEIIDGQARFEALKELGLPVRYVMMPGRTIEHTVAENATVTAWKLTDYLDCYTNRGDENYVRFHRLMDAHKGIPAVAIMNIVTGTFGGARRSSSKQNSVKAGNMIFSEEQAAEAEEVLAFVDKMLAISAGNGTKTLFCQGCGFICRIASLDKDRMLAKWEKLHAMKNLGGRRYGSLKELMEIMQAVYNYRAPASNVVYIATEYEQYCRQSNAAYWARWRAGRSED